MLHPAPTPHAEGLRVLVTADPTRARGPACTPELAAWLIVAGHAVALIDETGADARQWLHLAPTRPRTAAEAAA